MIRQDKHEAKRLNQHSFHCTSFITSPEQHGHVLHGAGHGNVVVALGDGGHWQEHSVAVGDLEYFARSFQGRSDVYITQNRFYGRRRAIACLRELDALFADIDYYNSPFRGRKPEQVLPGLLHTLDEAKMPPPSFAVSTGRGLALIWLHTAVPRQALPRWRACQQAIFTTLKDYGADARSTDAARVLRLIGTRNSKNGALVEAITPVGHVWVFDDLANEILPRTRAELISLGLERAKRRARGKKPNITPPTRLTAASLAETRLTDLQCLRQYRHGDHSPLPPGHRDVWLFQASCAMAYLGPPQVMEREVLALAEEAGWSEREARSNLSSVIRRAERAASGEKIEYRGRLVDPRYRFKDQTIIEWLGITEAEMRGANLRCLVTADIKRERDRQRLEEDRRAAGAMPRQQYEAGSLSKLKPWEAEGISRRTWYGKRQGTE